MEHRSLCLPGSDLWTVSEDLIENTWARTINGEESISIQQFLYGRSRNFLCLVIRDVDKLGVFFGRLEQRIRAHKSLSTEERVEGIVGQ